METLKPILKDLISRSASKDNLFKRNLLKEYLQVVVLDFIYSRPDFHNLIFYGGSCLAHCHNLPRLSEDLDFVDAKKEIDMLKLAEELREYFLKNTDLEVKVNLQKFRVYLKFPILSELNLAKKGESDLLFLKIEIFSNFGFCPKYETEILPLFKFNRSVLVRTFDLPTLMATKIRAVLFRKWEKMDKKGQVSIRVKGRDYFDLMWYLEKGIKPNLNCLENIRDIADLKTKLLEIVSKVDERGIHLDLEALIENKNFVINLGKNIKDILIRGIETM